MAAINFDFLEFEYANGQLRILCSPLSKTVYIQGSNYTQLVNAVKRHLTNASSQTEVNIVYLLIYWYLAKSGDAATAIANKDLLLSSTFILDFDANVNLLRRVNRP